MTALEKVVDKLKGKPSSNGSFQAKCPVHDDKTASLTISPKDGMVLIHCHAGCDTKVIVQAIGMELKDLFDSTGKGKKTVIAEYDYADEHGTLVYQVIRYSNKTFSQRRYLPDGKWEYNLKGVIQLPYNLPAIIANAGKRSIIIVEGEKDADNLVKAGVTCATCNSGGAGKWRPVLNKYFSGYNIIAIPDNDEPGLHHMYNVCNNMLDVAQSVRLVKLTGLKEKQDVTDWLKTHHLKELEAISKKTPLWTFTAIPVQTSTKDVKLPEKIESVIEHAPFRCLGQDRDSCYYLPDKLQQIRRISARNHTKNDLLFIADMKYWERHFATDTGVKWAMVSNALFRESERVGLFDSSRIRGCGAWYDEKRIVLHLGDRLKVDGETFKIPAFKTKYIYEAQPAVEMADVPAISRTEATKFADLCNMLAWEKPINARLFAGWCAIAPISGALYWRPHIWLTGSTGTGKSWIINNIIHSMLGKLSLFVQSNTTEAGIRQMLRNNSFPVIFDEAEAENRHSRQRLQSVLDLIRQASSESSAGIIKGTQGGEAMMFRIRSCFMLAGITVNIQQQADSSRISVLGLGLHPVMQQKRIYKEIEALVGTLLTKQYCGGFRMRSISLIPIIRKNAEIFATAVATIFGNQRVGDQLGALLAGAYSLFSNSLVTPEKAETWVEDQDWEIDSVETGDSEEQRCLDHILQSVINVEADGRRVDRSFGDLIAIASQWEDEGSDQKLEQEDAVPILARHGIKIIGDLVFISDKHLGIERILYDSNWGVGWKKLLLRIEGATARSSVRFEKSSTTRAVGIPLKHIFGE